MFGQQYINSCRIHLNSLLVIILLTFYKPLFLVTSITVHTTKLIHLNLQWNEFSKIAQRLYLIEVFTYPILASSIFIYLLALHDLLKNIVLISCLINTKRLVKQLLAVSL